MAAALVGLVSVLFAAALAWILSVKLRNASIVDVCWGPGFVLLAWIDVFLSRGFAPRAWLAAALVTLWGTRLSFHLFRRSRGQNEDPRYRKMRAAHGSAFWWHSLFTVFWLQAVILWLVALPLLFTASAAKASSLTALDGLGILLFVAGFTVEAVGDLQLQRFRDDPDNRGRVLDRGLWRYTRHPNYFGDAVLWWGVYALAASTPHGWLTVWSPLLMTWLLLRVSGVTLLEESLTRAKPGYSAYVARTPPFVPWFPGGS